MNFYPHHIGDFNSATRHLTRVERSVYRDAIELYYDGESALTKEIPRLEKKLLCRSEEEKKALIDVLDEFFICRDDGYFHERCDYELRKYQANTSAKARGGKASAEAKKKRKAELNKQNSTRVEQVLNTCSTEGQQNSTNQEPLTKNQEPLTISKKQTKKSSSLVKNTTLVFDHWKNETGHKKSKLDDARKKKIKFGLANFSVEDCLEAISGCVKTPHNQGDNDRNTEYLSISVIFKNAEQIERFIRNNKNPPAPSRANFWNEKGGFNAGNQEVRQHQKQSTVDGAVKKI